MALSHSQEAMLKYLRADTGMDDLSRDAKRTIAAADERYSVSSMRVVLSALRKTYPDTKLFVDELKRRRPAWEALDHSQEPTEKQIAKFISWDDLQTFRRDKKSELSELEYLLLSLYTMTAPARADYTPMRIVSRKPRTLADGENYLVLRPKTADFIFHAYKTHAKYGDKTVRVPRPLLRVIQEYLDERPGRVYLLEDEDHTPWEPQRLGANVRRIFQRFYKMDTGISMIRHAYLTKYHAGQKPLSELKAVADKMMHGVVMSQAYRFVSLE